MKNCKDYEIKFRIAEVYDFVKSLFEAEKIWYSDSWGNWSRPAFKEEILAGNGFTEALTPLSENDRYEITLYRALLCVNSVNFAFKKRL